MDIGRSVNFIREDEAWLKKIGIGGFLMLFPVVSMVGAFAFQGYLKKFFKNVLDGVDKPLPEWDDWGTLIIDGLKVIVVMFGYMIPIWILYGGSMAMFFIADSSGVGALRFVGMGCMCLALPLSIVLMLFGGAGLMRFFATDQLGEAFNFGEIMGFVKANIVSLLIAGLVAGLLVFVGELVGLLACFVGIFLTLPYAIISGWRNFADIYLEHSQGGA